MAEVKLLGTWFSQFTQRVEMGLHLKGVEYEFIQEDLSNKSDLLLKYNPVHKKVPVLLHNGKAIVESTVILEYIDDAFEGPPILPKDPYERAMARFWAKFIDEKCFVAMWRAYWSSADGKEKEKLKEEAIAVMKVLDNKLKDKKFFGGDTIGYVDIVAYAIACGIRIMEEVTGLRLLTEENHPNLCRYVNDYVNHDIVKKHLPDKDRITAFFKALAQPPTGKEYRPKVWSLIEINRNSIPVSRMVVESLL